MVRLNDSLACTLLRLFLVPKTWILIIAVRNRDWAGKSFGSPQMGIWEGEEHSCVWNLGCYTWREAWVSFADSRNQNQNHHNHSSQTRQQRWCHLQSPRMPVCAHAQGHVKWCSVVVWVRTPPIGSGFGLVNPCLWCCFGKWGRLSGGSMSMGVGLESL